jgi:hypothetical protein
VGWLSRVFGRGRRGARQGGLGAAGADQGVSHLRDFARSRRGVELYLEPETADFTTTVVAVAHDGEWTRRPVRSPRVAGDLARSLALPLYEAKVTGYPRRMKEWSRNHPERRLGPR